MNIGDLLKEYQKKVSSLEIELLIANSLGKSREFVLAHPEEKITNHKLSIVKKCLERRLDGEPVAHILGHKEFFGLDFEVNKHTLIPRPETELLVEQAIQVVNSKFQIPRNTFIIDVGTGSGNIIISLASELSKIKNQKSKIKFLGIDISNEALRVAKRNAKKHSLNKKIKFLQGNLLTPLIRAARIKNRESNLIILANLPYLSKKFFQNAPRDVKKFEPKSALYSPKKGLAHYEGLFNQIKKLSVINNQSSITTIIEYSPEQKKDLQKLIKKYFSKSKTSFHKDLSGKWRTAEIILQ